MAKVEFKWYGDRLRTAVEELLDESLNEIAVAVEEQARENQRSLDLIDTGFSVMNYYHITDTEDTYDEGWRSGRYLSRRKRFNPHLQAQVERIKAPKAPTPAKGEAYVGNAAPYFIWLELKYKLLYNALAAAADVTGGILKDNARERGL